MSRIPPGVSAGPTDLELLARWRCGDAAAGDWLFHCHYETVYRFFRNK
jgi:hypothetical protein